MRWERRLTQLLISVSSSGVDGVVDGRLVFLDGDVRCAVGDVGVVFGVAGGDGVLVVLGRHGGLLWFALLLRWVGGWFLSWIEGEDGCGEWFELGVWKLKRRVGR